MFVWALEGMASTATWKVPSCNGLGGLAARCQFGSTSDGKYISVVSGGGGGGGWRARLRGGIA